MGLVSGREKSACSHWLMPMCAALCVLGAVTGTAVFGKSFSDADVQAYIQLQRQLPDDFLNGLFSSAVDSLLILTGIALLSFFAFGWMAVPVLLFYSGLGVGTGTCCICSAYGLFGALYAFPVLVVPAICVFLSHSVLGRESLALSFGLFGGMRGKPVFGNRFKRLMINLPLCAAIDILAAALSVGTRMIMNRFIF